MQSGKNRIYRFAAVLISAAGFALSAQSGTIGGTNEDWNRWLDTAGLPEARHSLAVGVLNDSVYAIGGINNGYKTNVYCFDGTNWTEAAGLPAATVNLGAGALNGLLYAIGGQSESGVATNVYGFNGTTWTEAAGLPAARRNMAVGVLNNKLYAVGGWNGSYRVQTNVYCFDGTNWTETAGLPAARSAQAAGTLNGTLYVVGGYNGTNPVADVYTFNGTNWSSTAGLPQARQLLAVEVLSNVLYAVGGNNGGSRTNVYCFDGTNWTEMVGLSEPRSSLGAAALNGALYAVAGCGNDGYWQTNVYRYPGIVVDPGVSPSSGSWTGGYQVVITGTNLCDGTVSDVTNLTICGAAATVEGAAGSTQIIVTAGSIPRNEIWCGEVRVQSASLGDSAAGYRFTYTMTGPYDGGNIITITNAGAVFGTITNVLVGGISATILGSGENWARIVMPAATSTGAKDVVIQTSDNGDVTLSNVYAVNSKGQIGFDAYWPWTNLGDGMGDYVYALAFDTNGNLYAGGAFESAGGEDAYYIAKWDGANWTNLGDGVNGYVDALACDANGNLYVGGEFSSAGGEGANYIAKWDGANWSSLGDGVDGYVYALACDTNGNLYAGGEFSSAGGEDAYYIAKWDGADWSSLGDGMGSYVHALAFDTNGNLYAGGEFEEAGGEDVDYIAKWDGTNWSGLGDGMDNYVYTLACDTNGNLYAGGEFSSAGGVTANCAAQWNGAAWTNLGTGVNNDIKALAWGDTLYAGGRFSTAGGVSAARIAKAFRVPSFSGVVPSSCSVTGGVSVTISGTNLCDGTDITNVTICGVDVVSIDGIAGSTQVVVTAAASSPGLGDVRIYSANYGETVKPNAFTYTQASMRILGTNGAAIASGEAASTAKGTDFGHLLAGSVLTNIFSITNSGDETLTITGVTTNGAGANAFSISDLQFSIAAGGVSNFTVRFAPTNVCAYTAAVQIVHNSTSTPYVVYLAGEVPKHTQTITFPAIANQVATNTVGLAATASSGLPVAFEVVSGSAYISGSTNLSFSGAGQVSIRAGQTGNTEYAAAPDVTNTFTVSKADQTITFPAIQNQNVTSVVELTATASSDYEVRFAVISGPGTITITNGPPAVNTPYHHYFLSFTGTGTVLVAASQTGNEMWNAAPNVTNSVVVTNETPAGEGSLTAVIRPAEVIAAGAQWRVDGGAWRTSGTIVTGLTAGSHTVNYSEVAGYTNPADQAVTITPNQLAAVQGVYKLISGDTAYNPISADFDGDQVADPAICQPAGGLWLARFSGIGYQWGRMTRVFGPGGYAPVAADFDGDAKADPGLYNTTNGEWRAMFSNIGYVEDFVANLLGDAGSTAMAADFDGDAKADPAVYSPATGDWKVLLSSGGYLQFTADNLLGRTGFAAAAGDMDGDRLADPFVCDMATGQCMALLSSLDYARFETAEGFLGAPEWLLALADYDGDGLADPAIYDPETGALIVRLSRAGYVAAIMPEFLKP